MRCAAGPFRFSKRLYRAGGHVCLEQAPNSGRWRHEPVQNFLREIAAKCCLVPACMYQLPCDQHWMFAASMACLLPIAGTCEYERHSDVPADWIAEYPATLATAIVDLCLPMARMVLRDQKISLFDLSFQMIQLPEKGWDTGPTSRVDGGGYTYVPDWSCPPHGAQNRLDQLRKIWINYIAHHNLLPAFRQGLETRSAEPFFAHHHIANLRSLTNKWWSAAAQDDAVLDWTIPAGQPYALFALHKLSVFFARPRFCFVAMLATGRSHWFSQRHSSVQHMALHRAGRGDLSFADSLGQLAQC